MTSHMRLWVGAVGLAAATGCGPDGGPAEGGGLDSGDRPLELAFDTLYSVGAMEGDAWETFGSVSQVAFDAAGNLYIFDQQSARIVVVDPDGAFLREVGKKGGGPGEFQNPMRMAVAPDGGIAVADFGARGFTRFDARGEYAGTVRIEGERGLPTSGLAMHRTEPAVLAHGAGMVFRTSMSAAAGSDRMEASTGIPVRRISLETGQDTVLHDAWRPPPPEGPEDEVSGTNASGGRMVIRMAPQVAFQPDVHLGVLPDGRLIVADSTTYTIDILDADGRFETTLERPIQPEAVTDDIREKEKARRLALLDEGGSRMSMLFSGRGVSMGGMQEQIEEMQRKQIETLLFADVVPVISGIGVEWGGRIWVERTAAEPGEPGPIDVIDADGRYFGTIAAEGPRIPAAFGPDGLIAYIERDELDVPSVRTLRIRPVD